MKSEGSFFYLITYYLFLILSQAILFDTFTPDGTTVGIESGE